jgi:hypothetical protein
MRILFILTTFYFISCSTLKQIQPKDNRTDLTQNTLSKLNGNYEILSTSNNITSLDFALTFRTYWYSRDDAKTKYKISLKAIDNEHLITSIYRNDTLIKTKTLKGIVENNYFLTKSKKFPITIILNGYRSKTTRIGLLNSGDLLVDCKHVQLAFLLILPIPLANQREEEYDMVFRRINSTP